MLYYPDMVLQYRISLFTVSLGTAVRHLPYIPYIILRLFSFLGSDHRTILISMSLSSPGLLSAFWDPRANRVTPLPPPVRAARRRSRLAVLSRLVKQLIGGMRSWVRAAGALLRISNVKPTFFKDRLLSFSH